MNDNLNYLRRRTLKMLLVILINFLWAITELEGAPGLPQITNIFSILCL